MRTQHIPEFECEIFIASFLTGLNSCFWERKIKYQKLGLIDDGLGTLFNLKYQREFESPRIESVFKIYNFLAMINTSKLPRIFCANHIKKSITYYYSVYYEEHELFKTVHIPIFKTEKNFIITDEIAFIGQPFVEQKQISSRDYINMMEKIRDKFGEKISYFPHPKENRVNYEEPMKFFNIIADLRVEDYFIDRRPKLLLSISSSVLINLKLRFGAESIYYVKLDTIKNKDIYKYYDLLESMGIQPLNID
ncbi:polysialyltransferase family glycosyltransferase [Leadbetterella sp. DM7]|uniref:polysialyltransferase family glycosyltransferase n=1 Tax=Leadbetterella sp. DM7 TaxID=3235085 RepID=UPI00349E97E7